MSVLPGMTGPVSYIGGAVTPNRTLLEILTDLSLTTGLLLCFDLGDADCYSGTGQEITDTSAAGNDFWRGAANTVEATDPTFNGTAGRLTSAEYLSFDGGDFLTIQSSPVSFDALHKDTATWTVFAVVWPIAGAGNQQVFSNIAASGAGVRLTINSDEKLAVQVLDGSQNTEILKTADNALTAGAWSALATSISESAGASGGFLWRNGAYDPVGTADQWDPAYPSPGTGAAGGAETIGANANATGLVNSGTRLAAIAIWSAALTKTNLDAIWSALNGERSYA